MRRGRMQVAELNQEEVARLQAFEEEMGVYMVALEPQYPLANLSDDQVARLQQMERDLGVVLLAYKNE